MLINRPNPHTDVEFIDRNFRRHFNFFLHRCIFSLRQRVCKIAVRKRYAFATLHTEACYVYLFIRSARAILRVMLPFFATCPTAEFYILVVTIPPFLAVTLKVPFFAAHPADNAAFERLHPSFATVQQVFTVQTFSTVHLPLILTRLRDCNWFHS